MKRRTFVKASSMMGLGLSMSGLNKINIDTDPTSPDPLESPLAITMWEFSWLERRWPGAGYEDWEVALTELKQRGYNAIRIDAFPHLIHNDPEKEYLLRPPWSVQDWGSPALNRVRVQPNFIDFIKRCREYEIKIGLSTWWREDDAKVYNFIKSPEKLAEVWMSVLDLLKKNDLLDQIIYLDLSNEWPLSVWTPFIPGIDDWSSQESIRWMRDSIKILRAKYPQIPYTFSFTGEITADSITRGDLSMLDFLEPHIWMVNMNNQEFYEKVGYHYERFTYAGYDNLALKGEKLYRSDEAHWKEGLLRQITLAAEWSKKLNKPLITTECWGVVDYKDWPLLKWDWVKELCEFGATEAAKTGRWAAIATSNFCGPQFRGMWRDKSWHTRLTDKIKTSGIANDLNNSLLVKRI
jgi:hypothetical protein